MNKSIHFKNVYFDIITILPLLISLTFSITFAGELIESQYKRPILVPADVFVLKEDLRQEWINDQWNNYSKTTFDYNSSGNRTQSLREKWKDSVWVTTTKGIYEKYNADGNPLEVVSQYWNDTDWVNNLKWYYSYNTEGNITEDLMKVWKEGIWENQDRYTYTYDANGNMTKFLDDRWSDDQWEGSKILDYSYDQENDTTGSVLQWYMNGQWKNMWKSTWIYDSSGTIIEKIVDSWSADSQWVKYEKDFYTYDINTNVTELSTQRWVDSLWQDNKKISYTYDSLGNRIEELYQLGGSGNSWNNYEKWTFTYHEIPVPISHLPHNHFGSFKIKLQDKRLYIQAEDYRANDLVLKIYNLKGREIASLKSKEFRDGFIFFWQTLKFSYNVYIICLQDLKFGTVYSAKIIMQN